LRDVRCCTERAARVHGPSRMTTLKGLSTPTRSCRATASARDNHRRAAS
jgi:hypothetical protein